MDLEEIAMKGLYLGPPLLVWGKALTLLQGIQSAYSNPCQQSDVCVAMDKLRLNEQYTLFSYQTSSNGHLLSFNL